MLCKYCGKEISEKADICPYCGYKPLHKNKDWIITFLLCFFLGGIGAHRFYNGRTVSGIFQILTFGGFGIWVLVDLINILRGKFKNAEGKYIEKY